MFSIITVNKNNVIGLKNTIESIFSQKFKQFELVVIDGVSNDGSIQYLQNVRDRIDILIIEPDLGTYDAMNKGILKANGKYLLFLNSGDCFIDECILEKIYLKINQHPQYDIYFGDIEIGINPDSKIINYPKQMSLENWRSWSICHNACLIKLDLFKIIGLYDLKYSLAADYDWFLRALMSSKTFNHLRLTLINYDVNGASSKYFDLYQDQMNKSWNENIPIEINSLLMEFLDLRTNLSF